MQIFHIIFLFLLTHVRLILGVSQLYSSKFRLTISRLWSKCIKSPILITFFVEGDECLLVRGEGICKSAFDCQWIRDEQIHESEWTHCNFGVSDNLICCKDPDFTINDTLDCFRDTKDIFSYETRNECLKRAQSIIVTPNTEFSYDSIFYTDEQCQALHDEYENLDHVLGVANGNDSAPGEFPFMAVIMTLHPNGTYTRECGGTIITKR